jgi:hypothetical protein
VVLQLLVRLLVVVLLLWLRVPRMDWDCWGESWRRADTGTTDPTGTTTTVSIRVGAVRYGTVFTGQNETEVPGGLGLFPRGVPGCQITTGLAGSWWLKTDTRIGYECGGS